MLFHDSAMFSAVDRGSMETQALFSYTFGMLAREVTPGTQYMVRLVRDEDVLLTLAAFCKERGIAHGVFSAIGAIKNSRVGYYDLAKKEYGNKEYLDAMEVASMTGNVALVDGEPFIHCHVVLSGIAPGSHNQPIGGHLFEATVAVTLEVHFTSFTEPVTRSFDDEIGLKLLDLT